MAPPRLKFAKKNPEVAKLVDADDYLEAGDSHEEAMRKHRAGDPYKSLRFADRALDVYSQGLAKFPRNFDLAYNKARLELEKATDPVLSQALDGPALGVLRQALQSHQYARDLDPTHPDTLFNMAQVMTSMAEIMAEDSEGLDMEAAQYMQQALEVQTRCYEIQFGLLKKARELDQELRDTNEDESSRMDSTEDAPTSASTTQEDSQEEQWVTVEEPITEVNLLETILSQIETLSALCSVFSAALSSSPELADAFTTSLSWIDSFSGSLLNETLPALLAENRDALASHVSDVALPKAIFTSNYLELSFRLSAIDTEKYKKELDAAFSRPELDSSSEDVLVAHSRALLSLQSALADLASSGRLEPDHAALRWKVLIEAQSRLASAANIPNLDKHTLATTHLMRGDISLLLQVLAYPPNSHPQARSTTPQLLKNAEVYYRNAGKLFGSLGRSADEERSASELKGAVVGILQQVTTTQALAGGSSSGQDNTGTLIAVSASPDQIELALRPSLKSKGQQWTRDHVEDMISEGLILPEVLSALL
ncbi:hypothetical protein GGS20DRAFT_568641 [Poronia punctata]|nr:hypothetical protein GGS20DRAFT_568641 [Poronia punctata]